MRLNHYRLIALFTIITGLSGAAEAVTSWREAVKKIQPSVVGIVSKAKVMEQQIPKEFQEFFRQHFGKELSPRVQESLAQGSGFIVRVKDGKAHVMTNNHILDNTKEVKIVFHDPETFVDAKVVASDPRSDLAVLECEVPKGVNVSSINWAKDDALEVGDPILAAGNPLGFSNTYTAGIISNKARKLPINNYFNVYQVDAALNMGNSGGPLVLENGTVGGVVFSIATIDRGNVGIGFVIPGKVAKYVYEQLMKNGRVRWAWLGVAVHNLNPKLAESFGLKEAHGAVVVEAAPEGPADKAGVKEGDIILRFNGEKVSNSDELPRIVAKGRPDTKAEVVVWRDRKEKKLSVTLGEQKGDPQAHKMSGSKSGSGAQGTTESLGLTLEDLDPTLRKRYDIPSDVEGAVVSEVEANSSASEVGINPGFVILKVDSKEVKNKKEASEALESLKKENKEQAVLFVWFSGQKAFVVLPLAAKEEDKENEAQKTEDQKEEKSDQSEEDAEATEEESES